jgi:uncharacterized protein (DUF1501 family)
MKQRPFTRREFLRLGTGGLGLLSFSQFAPLFLTQSVLAGAPRAEKDRTILVLVQLAGGNDGLNTCIPFEDSNYYNLRPTLAIAKPSVLKLSDQIGLPSACQPLHGLLQEGKLSIIQNVGYPNPNRSHFRSMEIWETASDSDRYARTGWLGRFFDNACSGAPGGTTPVGVHLGNEVPQAFLADQPHSIHGIQGGNRARRQHKETVDLLRSLLQSSDIPPSANSSFLQHTMMNALATDQRVEQILQAQRPAVPYPNSSFAQSLSSIASLIAGGMETRVYFATLGGFDTHSNQATTHANLLKTLSDGLAAFQKDLERRKLADQVITMTFSEFGRRPSENDSGGTDHGTAAPLIVMGSRLKGGLFGAPPNLALERNRDLEYTTDFRQIYSTLLDQWLDCDSSAILGHRFPHLDFLAAPTAARA